MKKQTLSVALVIVGFLLGATALSALAQTFTAPQSAPPNGNVAAPINVGPNASTQVKSDAFVIQGLLGLSSLQFNPGGTSNVTPGKVLMAIDNLGDVAWAATSTMSSGGGGGSVLTLLSSEHLIPLTSGMTKNSLTTISLNGIVPSNATAVIIRGELTAAMGSSGGQVSILVNNQTAGTSYTVVSLDGAISAAGTGQNAVREKDTNTTTIPYSYSSGNTYQWTVTVPASSSVLSMTNTALYVVGWYTNTVTQ